jgi:hypothetical protein
METVCFVFMAVNIGPFLKIISSLGIIILSFFSLKYTIQRFYDLNVSGWYILLKLIPIFSIIVTLYLYFKKGDHGINDYDKAVNYNKILKNKHCIDIYKNKFIIDNETYQYETYLDTHIIKLSKYNKMNFIIEYLLKNYQFEEEHIYRIIKISKDELIKIIDTLKLIVIYDSFYLQIKDFKVFIRKENFKYTIILNKNDNKITKEMFDFFNFPGLFFEDENHIYYNGINKKDLLMWVKNGT